MNLIFNFKVVIYIDELTLFCAGFLVLEIMFSVAELAFNLSYGYASSSNDIFP